MSYMRFAKMHGAGNDFIVADQTASPRRFTPDRVRALCDRKRGIGADGLILLSRSGMPDRDVVRMEFFNCDGSPASMCGNGLRCAAAFAVRRCLAPGPDVSFLTPAGLLRTRVLQDQLVRIELPLDGQGFRTVELSGGLRAEAGTVGVPHAVVFVKDPAETDVETLGRMIRHHEAFQPEGTNADFLPEDYDPAGEIPIRTYERGVEAETLACGTGAGAAAYVLRARHPERNSFLLKTRSGDVLEISFPEGWETMKRMHLTGPAIESFHGATDAFDLD